jgi:hypothetical protein
MVIDEEEVS